MRPYHVVTPFRRYENYNLIGSLLQKLGVAQWVLLVLDTENLEAIAKEPVWLPTTIERFPKPTPADVGAGLVNEFVKRGGFAEGHRYCFLCDDDRYDARFFEEVDQFDKPVIITAMRRGQCKVGLHPCWDLHPSRTNLYIGGVGLEQGMFCGSVLNKVGPTIQPMDPNEAFLILAANEFPTDFAPKAQVLFNYYQPGRWTEL